MKNLIIILMVVFLAIVGSTVMSSTQGSSASNYSESGRSFSATYLPRDIQESNCSSTEVTYEYCAASQTTSNFSLGSSLGLMSSTPQSNDCTACIRKWCDFECSGYGDDCARCIKQWCDFEC